MGARAIGNGSGALVRMADRSALVGSPVVEPSGMIALYLEELANRLAPKIADLIMQRIQVPTVTPRWVDLEQAAILMSTTKDAVRGMARAKLFPVHKLGSRVMIDIRELEKAFAQNTVWLQ
jgi:hypothetical protein